VTATSQSISVAQLRESYDWKAAFAYASGFTMDDIGTVHGAVEGENDGDDWIIWGRLKDGRWFSLKAGCDYTGWDCQASGHSHTAATKKELIRMGMDSQTRRRFGLLLPEEKP
jgi:hypothetical protein